MISYISYFLLFIITAMSDTQKKETLYLGKCSARQMQSWTRKWLNISINKDEIAKHADDKGYVSLNIFERKEPDTEYGNTHSISVRLKDAE